MGLEPMTPTLKVLCSTSWASGSPCAYVLKASAKLRIFFWLCKLFAYFLYIFFNRYFSNSLLLYNLFACLLVYCLPYSLVCSKQNNRTRGEKDKTIGQEKIKKDSDKRRKKGFRNQQHRCRQQHWHHADTGLRPQRPRRKQGFTTRCVHL